MPGKVFRSIPAIFGLILIYFPGPYQGHALENASRDTRKAHPEITGSGISEQPISKVSDQSAADQSEDLAISSKDQIAIGSLEDIAKEIAGYDMQIQQYQASVLSKQTTLATLDKDIRQAENVQKEIEHRLSPLQLRREKMRFEAETTKKTLQAAIDNPRLVDGAKLDLLLKESQAASSNLEHAERELAVVQKDAESIKLRLEEFRRQRRLTELEIAVLNRTILNLLMKRPAIVEGVGECVMHEDITPKRCKDLALTKAKQDAVEKGGVSLVQSFAQVSMNDVVKDEIKIETSAHIRQMEIVQSPTRVEEGSLGKYRAKIRAVIQGVVRENRQRMFRDSSDGEQQPSRSTAFPQSYEDQAQPTVLPTSSFNLAYDAYLNGKFGLAVENFQRFIRTFPSTSLTPNAYYWLGESYYGQKDYVRAIQSFEHVVNEYAGNEKVPAALFKVGLSAAEMGDKAKSRKYLKRVIEEYSTSDEAKLAKAKIAELR